MASNPLPDSADELTSNEDTKGENSLERESEENEQQLAQLGKAFGEMDLGKKESGLQEEKKEEEKEENKEEKEELDFLGAMTIECDPCGSLFFEGEEKFCCNSGAIKIANPFDNFPNHDGFVWAELNQDYLRKYNNDVAFVHFAEVEKKKPIRWQAEFRGHPESVICDGKVQHVAVEPKKYKDVSYCSENVKKYFKNHNTISKVYGMLPMLSLSGFENVNPVSFLHNLLCTQGGFALDLDSDDMLLPRNSPLIDPMAYPFFFPNGTFGWHEGLKSSGSNDTISQIEYYKYLAMKRKSFNPIHYARLLSRQFLIDVWARIDLNRLNNFMDIDHKTHLTRDHPGSYRNLAEERLDSLAIFSKFGDPHFFITFTANPKWREIQENLGDCKDAHDRPDLIARVFKLKVDRMLHRLVKEELFGEVKAYATCYEWQKRGLPHIHLLLTMEHEPSYERIICSEDDEALYKIVNEHMKEDNGSIANYNPALLRIFDAHINVEPMDNDPKYRINYIHKGSAKEANKIWKRDIDNKEFDEAQHYLQNRSFCAPEACHRLFGFPVFQRSHEVYPLPIGVPPNEPTELTEYFKTSSKLSYKLLYEEFPSKFQWDGSQWKKIPVPDNRIIGRLESVSPTDKEFFALRCLLMKTPGATSFEGLRTSTAPGPPKACTIHKSFFDAASARKLFTSETLKKGLEECKFLMSYDKLKETFVEILMTYELDQQEFWKYFKRDLAGNLLPSDYIVKDNKKAKRDEKE